VDVDNMVKSTDRHRRLIAEYLYINKGDGTFQDASFYSDFALTRTRRRLLAMGLAVGDYANNGRLDLYTTTFSDDYKALYRNDGQGNSSDITRRWESPKALILSLAGVPNL